MDRKTGEGKRMKTKDKFYFIFFDRKLQRNILKKRKYKRRMRNPPTKEKQNYKESNIRKYKVKTSKLSS